MADTKKMLIDATHPEETRVVVVNGQRVEEFDYESASRKPLRGNIYLAKITRVEPSLQAAFVEYGGNRHGFLAFNEIHPDYYQIPVADREALVAEEAREAREANDEDDAQAEKRERNPKRRRRTRRRGGSQGAGANAETTGQENGADDDVSAQSEDGAPTQPTADDVDQTGDAAPAEATEGQDAVASDAGADDASLSSTDAAEAADAAEDTSASETDPTQDTLAVTETDSADVAASDDQPQPHDGVDSAADDSTSSEAEVNAPDDDAPKEMLEAVGIPDDPVLTEETADAGQPSAEDETDVPPSSADERAASEAAPTVDQDDAAPTETATKTEIADAAPVVTASNDDEPAKTETPDDSGAVVATSAASDDDSDDDGEDDDADDDSDDDEDGNDEDDVEDVGRADAMEEVPNRTRRMRKNYKIQEVLKRRQIVLVQVVKEERGNKGAALTTYLSLAGRYTVLMPNTARGGGISRKISQPSDRKRLRAIADELDVPEGMGLIIRTAGAARTKAEIKRDYEYLLRLWENVRDLTLQSIAPALVYEEGNLIKRSIRDLYSKEISEVVVAGEDAYREAKDFMRMLMPSHAKNVQPYRNTVPLFAKYKIERHLSAMFNPVVQLKSGGYIVINQTEALVAVDVNSGKSTKEHNIEDTATSTNLEAAEEVARQLKLRDLAGLVVIDFIDMEDRRNNRKVENRLKDSLKNDRARIQLGRISAFGLLELSRQRLRTGVLEGSTSECPHCQGTGVVRSVESVALAVLRSVEDALVDRTPATVTGFCDAGAALYILNQKRDYLADIEARTGANVLIEADRDCHGATHRIEKSKELAIAPPPRESETNGAVSMLSTYEEGLDETEPDVADEDEAAVAHTNGDARPESDADDSRERDNSERPKRRRRRRGGRGRDDNEARADNDKGDQPTDLDAADDADGDELEARDGDANGNDDDGDARGSRSRRRGRRGGRRNRRGKGNGEDTVETAGDENGNSPTGNGAKQDGESEHATPGSEQPQIDVIAWPTARIVEAGTGGETAVKIEYQPVTEGPSDEATVVAEPAQVEADEAPTNGRSNGAEAVETSPPSEEADAAETTQEDEVPTVEADAAPEAPEPTPAPAAPPQPARRGWWQLRSSQG